MKVNKKGKRVYSGKVKVLKSNFEKVKRDCKIPAKDFFPRNFMKEDGTADVESILKHSERLFSIKKNNQK